MQRNVRIYRVMHHLQASNGIFFISRTLRKSAAFPSTSSAWSGAADLGARDASFAVAFSSDFSGGSLFLRLSANLSKTGANC